ncbi:MAG: hypothetical protein ACOX0E_05555 [Syntrophomonadaceae bacterium]|jgi:cell division protein FtsL
MVQAGYDYARDLNQSVPKTQTSQRIIKRTIRKKQYGKAILFKAAVFLFIYAVLLVTLCVKGATLGYQIVALQQDVNNLQSVNLRLQYQIGASSSLERIEQIATAELGMVKANESFEYVCQLATATGEYEREGQQVTDRLVEKEEKPMEKIFSNLMLLASISNR